MNDRELLDLYSDYLISSFGQTTGTGLSALLGGSVSHDRIQRFLSQREFTSADLWHVVKPHVRAIERPDGCGCLIIDDSISEKRSHIPTRMTSFVGTTTTLRTPWSRGSTS
jgi:hypothetical protein